MYPNYFSNQFYYFLIDIKKDNILARFLVDYNGAIKSEFTFIDVVPEDKVTFLQTEKLEKLHKANENPQWNNSINTFIDCNRGTEGIIFNNNLRTEIKIGRLLKKIFEQEEFSGRIKSYFRDYGENKSVDELIELLINAYKCQTKRIFDENFDSKLVLLSGEDIRKYYNQENYLVGKGSLHDSCMRHSKCSGFLDIYTKNPEVCQMLVFKEEDKISMRALVWKLSNGETYMDRVYAATYSDAKIFNDYAKKNNWWYFDSALLPSDNSKVKDLVVNLQNVNFDYYPYMDTFVYLDMLDKKLVRSPVRNDGSSEVRRLRSQEGGWSNH